eukprot:TRINITY_DN1718_c0_g3_i1.p1 TRINITY_DN1718_c0_g3~~TRINITY_DN1718_c0_g3_i1.p1  ORF type:complete len:289 (+),score=112.88 TRINITY_DN1718_c0_g3_i1:58-924(+)
MASQHMIALSKMDSEVADINNTRSSYATAASADEDQVRWCNFLYTTKCPFSVNHACGTMEPCKFVHLDSYVQVDEEDRPDMPNVMARHVKSLIKEMTSVLFSQARKNLTSWLIKNAWGENEGQFAELNPFKEVVTALRKLGWVIPETRKKCTSASVDRAPYAQDVVAIVSVIANCLHYNIEATPQLMFDTIAWAFTFATPVMKCPEPELEDDDIMVEFIANDKACYQGISGASEASSGYDSAVSPSPSPGEAALMLNGWGARDKVAKWQHEVRNRNPDAIYNNPFFKF